MDQASPLTLEVRPIPLFLCSFSSSFGHCLADSHYLPSIRTPFPAGRPQIFIPSNLVWEKSYDLGHATYVLGNILTDEIDHLFAHQYNESAPCREYPCLLCPTLPSVLSQSRL